MITEIGKILRSIRIESKDSLRDMANKLSISPAMLSSIENGKRNATDELLKPLCEAYKLNDEEQEKIKHAIYASNNNYRVDLSSMNDKSRQILISVAEGNLDEEVLTRLCEVVSEDKENKENK